MCIRDRIRPYQSTERFFSSGSYLMCPWLGRLYSDKLVLPNGTEVPLDTSEGKTPLHGLYYSYKRKVVERKETASGEQTLTLDVLGVPSGMPSVQETFILRDSTLLLATIFSNADVSPSVQFVYGYHPYLTLDHRSIDGQKIRSNLANEVLLDRKRLVPLDDTIKNGPLQETLKLDTLLKEITLDNCFAAKDFTSSFTTQLVDEELGLAVEVTTDVQESEIPAHLHGLRRISLPFCQMYTPPTRTSVAIEPQSSVANIFNLPADIQSQLVTSLAPGERAFGIFKLRLLSL
eukprot:TRINITY_DN4267_c0_g1_i2.p1 TRINITY_DN4267_c0_g1~~TRINITY_DN4267_c0_g1_i2.p1  ORF type:complete len:309 (+),score=87.78 TRINITY_DN4267_c0_g1_i2:60-929(+)